MIISASRRTDIPAFYPEWFMKRMREGYFYRVNPFNPKQMKGISLLPEDVDVIVFWTKNARPMVNYLGELTDKGYRFYFQFTLNDYPPIFEPNLPPLAQRMNTFMELSQNIGKAKVVWRYDPIIVTAATSLEYHIGKFKKIAGLLNGYTERVMISFVDLYAKVNSRWQQLDYPKTFVDIREPAYRKQLDLLLKKFVEIAGQNQMKIFTCAETVDLLGRGIEHGSCIDIQFINNVFNLNLTNPKDKSQRPECLCAQSVDIGMYNTCKHLCSYCYANLSEKAVNEAIARHDDSSPILVGQTDEKLKIVKDHKKRQMTLFE